MIMSAKKLFFILISSFLGAVLGAIMLFLGFELGRWIAIIFVIVGVIGVLAGLAYKSIGHLKNDL